jgi:hypothetical protein
MRPRGFARLSTELDVRSLAGVRHADPAPMESLNSEWGRLEIDGQELLREPDRAVTLALRQKLKAELINTGGATWVSGRGGQRGTVWVQTRHQGHRSHLLEVPTTAFGRSASLSWVAPETGTFVLRPYLEGAGGFGEPLRVEVR